MNPNLHIFFKRSVYVIIFGGIIAGLIYSITRFTTIDLAAIGEYLMFGFFGLVMAFMFVLIIGVTLKKCMDGYYEPR